MLLIALLPSGALSLLQQNPARAAAAEPVVSWGGSQPEQLPPPRPRRMRAKILANGKALVPDGAPPAVQAVIRAGNKIVGRPYSYGGGHGSFNSSGYDCSGSVSYALHGGRFISAPMASGDLSSWGRSGKGRWITVFANGGHAFMNVAGIRLDTSSAGDPGGSKGPRWRPVLPSTEGYVSRHPRGL